MELQQLQSNTPQQEKSTYEFVTEITNHFKKISPGRTRAAAFNQAHKQLTETFTTMFLKYNERGQNNQPVLLTVDIFNKQMTNLFEAFINLYQVSNNNNENIFKVNNCVEKIVKQNRTLLFLLKEHSEKIGFSFKDFCESCITNFERSNDILLIDIALDMVKIEKETADKNDAPLTKIEELRTLIKDLEIYKKKIANVHHPHKFDPRALLDKMKLYDSHISENEVLLQQENERLKEEIKELRTLIHTKLKTDNK